MTKNTLILLAVAAALAVCSCAKEKEYGKSELAKDVYDAWVQVNNPGTWTKTDLGSWIMEWDEGDPAKPLGATDDTSRYVLMDFTITNRSTGEIQTTTSATVAKQIRDYESYYYYGPQCQLRSTSGMYVGIVEVLDRMCIGGHVKLLLPGWLQTTTQYSNPDKYVQEVSGTDAIYDFTVVDMFDDVVAWEEAQIEDAIAGRDTVCFGEDHPEGFYYIREREADADTTWADGDEVYINYICRRLDGTAVDSNIADTAKVYGFYSASTTYEPTLINWGENYDDLTMTSSESSMIEGFSYAIFNMQPHEKASVYFVSDYGYTSSGSGDAIPPYCPLLFEIELVDEPED